ncbi:MAG TPA: hypothetical protein VN457_05160, partial [Chlamydiales bacterium]|nr:hypothetical protein [Chlamydiales bacterium]
MGDDSLSLVRRQLETIATELGKLPAATVNPIAIVQDSQKPEVVQIKHEYTGYGSWCWKGISSGFWKTLDRVTSCCGGHFTNVPQIGDADTQATTAYLQRLFGEKRVEVKPRYYKSDIERLFLNVADVNWNDLLALFSEIKDETKKRVRFFN